jgi:hypothetical protein
MPRHQNESVKTKNKEKLLKIAREKEYLTVESRRIQS